MWLFHKQNCLEYRKNITETNECGIYSNSLFLYSLNLKITNEFETVAYIKIKNIQITNNNKYKTKSNTNKIIFIVKWLKLNLNSYVTILIKNLHFISLTYFS